MKEEKPLTFMQKSTLMNTNKNDLLVILPLIFLLGAASFKPKFWKTSSGCASRSLIFLLALIKSSTSRILGSK